MVAPAMKARRTRTQQAPAVEIPEEPLHKIVRSARSRVIRIKAESVKPAPDVEKDEEGEEGSKRTDYAEVVRRYAEKVTNRKSAIRAFCVQCSCGALSEVKNCGVVKCPLWPYRLGEDPGNAKSIARKAREQAKANGTYVAPEENDEGEDE